MYNRFLELMHHYEMVSKSQKAIWDASIHPEQNVGQKEDPNEFRNQKIAALKEKKLLEATMEKLKDSEEIPEVREFWISYIKQSVMKACDALKTIDLEF